MTPSHHFHKTVEAEGAALGSHWSEHTQGKSVAPVANLQGSKMASVLSGSEEAEDRRGSTFNPELLTFVTLHSGARRTCKPQGSIRAVSELPAQHLATCLVGF